MYVGPGDGDAAGVLFRDLLGLLYVRTFGNRNDLDTLIQLSNHLSALGKRLPVYALSVEKARELLKWDPDMPSDLLGANHDLKVVHFPRG